MKAPANTETLTTFFDRFSPRTVATNNNNDIMVAKLEGSFHWHKHDDTDDFFLVLKGTLDIELRDHTVILNSGEIFVVPKGVEHRPVARGEVHILLIEPTGTPNTVTRLLRRRAFLLDRSLHYRAYWHFSDAAGLTDDVGFWG